MLKKTMQTLTDANGKTFIASDDIVTLGVLSTAGSKMLEGFAPPFDASVVAKLKAAGYSLLGKAKMSEFALMALSDDLGAHAAAKALAESESRFAIASDAWGQNRVSAVKAGMLGFKPSYGFVSRVGLISSVASMETIGVVARDASAALEALKLIAFEDAADATSVAADLSAPAQKPKIGVMPGFDGGEVDAAAKALQAQGYEIVKLPALDISLAKQICDVISCVEFASMSARYDGVKYGYRADMDDLDGMYGRTRAQGFGEAAKLAVLLGTTYMREKYYEDYHVQAMKLRRKLKESMAALFNGCGAWLLRALCDEDIYRYTRLANLSGFPAAAMRGVQIMGAHGSDVLVLNVCEALEKGEVSQ